MIDRAHQAALAPNKPEGICPPAKSDFNAEWTSLFLPQRSRNHPITLSPGTAVGHDAEQLGQFLAAEASCRERQFLLAAQRQWRSGSRIGQKTIKSARLPLCPAQLGA